MTTSATRKRIIFLAACAAFTTLVFLAWPFTVDDAYIIGRYARNVARGAGYAFNRGQISDGVTSPLTAFLGAFCAVFGMPIMPSLKVLGAVCGVAALAATTVPTRVSSRTTLPVIGGVALALSQGMVLIWSVAGLETGIAALAFSLLALSCSTPKANSKIAHVAFFVVAWTRPELVIASSYLVWELFRRTRQRSVLLLAVISLASIAAFRHALFGHALPLSFFAKHGSLANGAEYAFRALWSTTSLVGIPFAIRGARVSERASVFAKAIILHTVAVVLAGGDWMPGSRLFVPVIPLYVGLTSLGVASSFSSSAKRAVAVLALAILPVTLFALALPELRANAALREKYLRPVVNALRERGQRTALVDIGYLGFESDVEIVDLAGLVDDEIGHARGGHLDKEISAQIFARRNPQIVLLHASRPWAESAHYSLSEMGLFPVEKRVFELAEMQQQFRWKREFVILPSYRYEWFERIPLAPHPE